MKAKRKTHTSTAVKRRWNEAHYDRIHISVPIGAKDEIHAIAAAHGMSTAAYIKHLIIADNSPENCPILSGGGGTTH